MKKLYIISLIIFSIFQACSSPKHENEQNMIFREKSCYFINNKDSIKLGNLSLEKDLFKEMKTELFPNIQYEEEGQPPHQKKAYEEIQGIYINSKIFDSFIMEGEKIKKVGNDFDVLFIFPEKRRYNFQFNEVIRYRVFHYLGFLYQDPSSRQNLPCYVKNITKLNDNSIIISYEDKSNYMRDRDKMDSLIFTTCPNIKLEFSNENVKGFQKTTEYIKLSENMQNISLSVPTYSLPQDITEIYITEIITHLINLKYNSQYKTSDIIEKLE